MVNVKDVQLGTTTRKSFAKINEVMKMPNLIEVQKHSYDVGFLKRVSKKYSRISVKSVITQVTLCLILLTFQLTTNLSIQLHSVRLVTPLMLVL